MDSLIDSITSAFEELVSSSAQVERVAAGFKFTEGPVWVGDQLLFSDIPNDRIVRWRMLPEGPEVGTFRTPSGNSNGLALDRQCRLLACEHGNRRVSRTDADGRISVLADRYQGRRLNSPNDVVVRSDGIVYFTDPPYGLRDGSEREVPFNGLYAVATDGSLLLLADDFDRPNGLAFSPDEHLLYVDDSTRRHIRVFEVHADGTIGAGRVFADLPPTEQGVPDGMKIDIRGSIYCTGGGGICVYSPEGTLVGKITLPEIPANLAWGDSDWTTLYITARTSIYRLRAEVPGVPPVPKP